jgi:hypothetical protein
MERQGNQNSRQPSRTGKLNQVSAKRIVTNTVKFNQGDENGNQNPNTISLKGFRRSNQF